MSQFIALRFEDLRFNAEKFNQAHSDLCGTHYALDATYEDAP